MTHRDAQRSQRRRQTIAKICAMTTTPLQTKLDAVGPAGSERVTRLIDVVLADAQAAAASDVHFEPTPNGIEVRYRLDGVVHAQARLPRELAPNLVARLKVLAELLTYRQDIPQEGSIRVGANGAEMRVSTFPTIHGEKVVVRVFHQAGQLFDLTQLGLPSDIVRGLFTLLQERTGAIFLTGPSGSGKTTTIYACLRHLVQTHQGGRHIVTIEDPVEQVIDGISQSQARPGSEFDFARGLRSLLRQDPEIIMIGEVRDPDTASIAIEAALTGHLVFSTLHAGSSCGVVGRLLDMGIEPYLLTSGLKGILNQRLVRRRCASCSGTATHCPHCLGSGYRGRLLLSELVTLDESLRQGILQRLDTNGLEAIARHDDRRTIWTAAADAVREGSTTWDEVERVLGPRPAHVPAG